VPEDIRKCAKTTGILAIVVSAGTLLWVLFALAEGVGGVISLSLPVFVIKCALLVALGTYGYQLLMNASKDVVMIGKIVQLRLVPAMIALTLLSVLTGNTVGLLPLVVVAFAALTIMKVKKYRK
jgi:hypothetical protein